MGGERHLDLDYKNSNPIQLNTLIESYLKAT